MAWVSAVALLFHLVFCLGAFGAWPHAPIVPPSPCHLNFDHLSNLPLERGNEVTLRFVDTDIRAVYVGITTHAPLEPNGEPRRAVLVVGTETGIVYEVPFSQLENESLAEVERRVSPSSSIIMPRIRSSEATCAAAVCYTLAGQLRAMGRTNNLTGALGNNEPSGNFFGRLPATLFAQTGAAKELSELQDILVRGGVPHERVNAGVLARGGRSGVARIIEHLRSDRPAILSFAPSSRRTETTSVIPTVGTTRSSTTVPASVPWVQRWIPGLVRLLEGNSQEHGSFVVALGSVELTPGNRRIIVLDPTTNHVVLWRETDLSAANAWVGALLVQ